MGASGKILSRRAPKLPVRLRSAIVSGLLAAAAAVAQERNPREVPLLTVAVDPLLTQGDARYQERQEGRRGARASLLPISGAIAAYEEAARRHRHDPEPRWKLARALYFKASYTGLETDARLALFEKARRAGEEALGILAERAQARGAKSFSDLSFREKAAALHDDRNAAPSYFWTAVAWGEWALAVGKLNAARTGAAERIRDYARMVIALDSEFEEGGGYRVLGRLHDQAPRIPLLTGWVSRKEALRNLRLAVKVAPENFVNRHFLSEALAEGSGAERAEAVRIAKSLVAGAPSPGHLVEELKIQENAKRNLKTWSR